MEPGFQISLLDFKLYGEHFLLKVGLQRAHTC